mmetsp:Transcript_122013/g.304481  ORF Transcript_122013/g.304481 Transcript_122013/m.304481 type:complete len:1901 (-) Transcript_122013:56-5758(-)
MGGLETYVVSTKANDMNEVVVRTLVGEYVETGSNHGRKVYRKMLDRSAEAVDVFLYYWDGRDGPTFEGWWFGNKLGGTQVWSHCTGGALTPPPSGWKIPWDGAPRPTLVVENKATQQRAQVLEKLGSISKEVQEVGQAARKALDEACTAHQGAYHNAAGLKAAEEMLTPHPAALNEALKKVMEAQRTSVGDASRQFLQLGTAVRNLQAQVGQELTKLRGAKVKAEQEEKAKAAEEKDTKVFQAMLPECQEKANTAEDLVEKAVITSEMIQAGGDNLEEVRKAVGETEAATKAAQMAIGEARIFLNTKQGMARSFESAKVKEQSVQGLTKLQMQLQEAQNKLNPLKTVRQDFEQRQTAQQIVAEVMEKLTPAEVECDKAEEATLLLAGEGSTKEMMSQADAAVQKASTEVSAVLRLILMRKQSATGLVLSEIKGLEDRAKNADRRLVQLKASHKEAAERVSCEVLMREATEKMATVQDTVSKAANAEGPFLMGVEELPLEETLVAVKACETAATSANTAVSIARMFIATKLIEAKRFSPKSSQEATAKLKELQKVLDTHTKRLTDLKTNTAMRKKKALMREAEMQVADAEAATKAMTDVAGCFEDDAKLAELSSEDIKKAAEETAKAEVVATAKLSEARKYIHVRQIEAKGKEASAEVGAELIKYNTRISTAQGEVAKYKKLVASVGDRLQARKVMEEALAKVKEVEEKVDKVHSLVMSQEGQDVPPEAVKEAETGLAECQAAIRQLTTYLQSVSSRQTAARVELSKLQPRVKELQEKLDAGGASMRTRAEQVEVKKILADAEQKLSDAEASVKAAREAEMPFLKGDEVLSGSEATKAFEELDKGVVAANAAFGAARTFVAMKRLAVKRLTEKAAAAGVEGLNKLQERLDAASKMLQDIKANLAKRKHESSKREVELQLKEMENLVQVAKTDTAALVEGTDLAPDAMKGACEKAGTSQSKAKVAVEGTKALLREKQREIRTHKEADASIAEDLSKMMEVVTKAQAELDTQVGHLRDQEHKFVAQRLVKDATDQVEVVEKKLADTTAVAAPLVSEQKEDFGAALYLTQLIEALRQHMASAGKTLDEIYAAASGGAETLSEAAFAAFVGKLPEVTEKEDCLYSEDELKAAFKRIAEEGKSEISKAQFKDQFRSKYFVTTTVAMTDSLAVKGGKTVRKLGVNEVIEALEEPSKDPGLGLARVKARAEKDQKEGYITLRGNQGTDYLAPYDPYVACENRVEGSIQELLDAANGAQRYVEKKIGDLKGVDKGPLGDARSAMLALKPRISQVQQAQVQLKRKVAQARKQHQESLEAEKQRRQAAIDRRAATAIMDEAASGSKAAEEQVEKAIAAADVLVKSKGSEAEESASAFSQAEKDLTGAAEASEKVEEQVKDKLDELKAYFKGPFSEARSALNKLKVRLVDGTKKCKKQVAALKAVMKQMESDAHEAIVTALTAHVKKTEGLDPEGLFKQLSNGEASVPSQGFAEFVEKLPGLDLKKSHLNLGLQRYSAGVTRLSILSLFQHYLLCVKEIAITSTFEVKDSKTIRKLIIGEVVCVLEDEQVDEGTGLARCKIHALMDGKEGWATLRGNQGTGFLDKCPKPFYICDDEVQIQEGFSSNSAEIRRMRAGEVLELLEGPRKEDSCEIQRVRGVAARDNAEGWVTLKDASGAACLEQGSVLVCRQSIALTPAFDIGEGKPVRKLDVGEAMEVIAGPQEDDKRGMSRIHVRTKLDGKEGWVTMKGNQGTAYMEQSDRHHICKVAVPLEQRFECGSALVRSLEAGELFEIREGPQAQVKEGASRLKGRSLSDGTVGWFNGPNDITVPWTPLYTCRQGTTLTDGLEVSTSKAVRKLEPGEQLEALDMPVVEKATGLMRVRLRCERDGACGFVTVRSSQGVVILESRTTQP